MSTTRPIEANRRNAQKSTGPRTARGKAQSRLNGLRHGFCSPTYRRFWLALFEAPPGCPVAKTVCNVLAPEESLHPVFADLIDVHFEMEMQDRAYNRRMRRRAGQARRDLEQSLEPLENNGSSQNKNTLKLTSY